jgi:hypothetical protein
MDKHFIIHVPKQGTRALKCLPCFFELVSKKEDDTETTLLECSGSMNEVWFDVVWWQSVLPQWVLG